jgi:hypothetical protein
VDDRRPQALHLALRKDARWADPVGSPEFVGIDAIGGFWTLRARTARGS